MDRIWTADEIRPRLQSSQVWLERAIVAVYKMQTKEEQRAESTLVHNGVGFNGCDARTLSYYAKWILSGKTLSGKHLHKARRMMLKYSEQLAMIANLNEIRRAV